MHATNSLDPITVEVIRSYYQSTARQMRSTLIRASFNPIIYEMIDFSLGIYNRDAELIAEGPGIPFFMGTLSFTIRHVVNYIGVDNIEDGDVLLSTYPYWIGSHSQDAAVIRPVFVDGKIFGYTAVKAHWVDIGAKDIYGTDTTDIWQEGLQLFGVKVMKRGRLDGEILEIVRANSRLPDSVVGDLTAQVSACNRGAQQVLALVKKYGADTVNAAVVRILDHGEEVARQAIASIPDGEWSVGSAMDSNGISDDPVPLRATLRIQGDEMHVSTDGSASQQVGPVNCPLPSTVSGIRLVMKMIVAPTYDANEGFFRPLKVSAPEGSIFNPRAPAPVFLYGWTAMVMAESLFKVIAGIAPARAVARSGGDLGGILFSGHRSEDGAFFAGGADESCGQGASCDEDGESALILYALGESSNVPVEIMEERWPVLVEKYELWADSGGAGRYRGGLGVRKRLRALADLKLINTIEQTKSPAWGVDGGHAGTANSVILGGGTGRERRIGKVSGVVIPAGESLDVEMGGGGGWGDPKTRDPERVLADVRGGYVSVQAARDDYGVAISGEPGQYRIDMRATRDLRAGP